MLGARHALHQQMPAGPNGQCHGALHLRAPKPVVKHDLVFTSLHRRHRIPALLVLVLLIGVESQHASPSNMMVAVAPQCSRPHRHMLPILASHLSSAGRQAHGNRLPSSCSPRRCHLAMLILASRLGFGPHGPTRQRAHGPHLSAAVVQCSPPRCGPKAI